MLGAILAIVICQIAGALGAVVTAPAIPAWYAGLTKPAINPPNWVFGPVWTLLYTLMGIAVYLVWKKGIKKPRVRLAVTVFGIHLAVNTAWSIVFFGFHAIASALFVIFILWSLIVILMKLFHPIDKRATYFLVPYLAWVSFAAILNFWLLILNP